MIGTNLQIFANVIPLFEKSVTLISGQLEKPSWSGDEIVGYQPRFANPNSGHFQLLMAAKTVSTLNAVINLLKDGYIQEIGILLRVIDECNAKILCIEEAHVEKILTAEQKKIINEYFQFDIRNVDDISNTDKWWINMKKVFASEAHFLSEGTPNKDIHKILENCKIIYDVYTGYVHGFYPHVMELYDTNKGEFQMKGLPNTKYHQDMSSAVASSILRTFNVFAQISLRFNLIELRKELIDNRDKFIETQEYKKQNGNI